jgi:serine/threonine-protein kinase
VTVARPTSAIWLLDRRQGTLTRLTFDSSDTRPSWTPDGRRVAYVRQRGSAADLRIINADGSAPAESLLADSGRTLWAAVFTPDRRAMIVRSTGPGGRDIWRVSLDSTRTLTPLLQSAADEIAPALSPDGRWLTYVSNESGRNEVYVRSFPGMGARYQVSLDGGNEPVWSPRGGELFYRNGADVLVAAVRVSPGFEVTNRATLFSNPDYSSSQYEATYDVSPDGQQFVMVRRTQAAASDLTITLHWFDNIRARRADGHAEVRQQ